ncbi:unnamed protein product [Linum tenue]|uniref:Uncharacterized protein n=1 Tax=Linum tenue TaxID=586396 RepID=A0AAV0Q4U9_9ROSI|nr:unnamed protein product [Linum tenue]
MRRISKMSGVVGDMYPSSNGTIRIRNLAISIPWPEPPSEVLHPWTLTR